MITVQRATIEMLPELMKMSPKALAQVVKNTAPLDMNAWVAELYRFMNAPDRRLLVAVSAGRVVGWHIMSAQPLFFAPSVRVAQTIAIWVDPESRSGGAGMMMQKAGEAWAREVGAKIMTAGVSNHEDADRAGDFFLGLGYRSTGSEYMKAVS